MGNEHASSVKPEMGSLADYWVGCGAIIVLLHFRAATRWTIRACRIGGRPAQPSAPLSAPIIDWQIFCYTDSERFGSPLIMHSTQQLRSRMPQYSRYVDDNRSNFREPLLRRHTARDSKFSDKLSIEEGVGANRFRPQSWSGRTLFFDETIGLLDRGIEAADKHIKPLQEAFQKEVAGIRLYATQNIIDELWEMRLDIKPKTHRRNSKKEDDEGESVEMDEMMQMSKQAKQAWAKIDRALQAAANGTKSTVSPGRRSIKKADDKPGIERTVSKLQTSGSQCLDLLAKSRKKYSEIETLMKELDFLRQIIEEWTEFADAGGEEETEDDY
ncbi:hypothetical protein K505DRAFT_14029 [Melanomma pulvis-pyrius CBS 109.77]|uniref:Uncharacterized protein n=1 Tax=Melanomma pulvis-pyrius CBS 109.77 TaxID=1314802 RepID=A0A6A6XGE1_9PLEO|nr:hypothetical protein K505DRAFT_14029 [Melanomma pulvis-pyrius CBS 109.77]